MAEHALEPDVTVTMTSVHATCDNDKHAVHVMVNLPSSALPLGSYPPGTTRLEAWVGHTIKKKSKRHKTRNADASTSGAASADAPSQGRLRQPQQHQLTEQCRAQGVALLLVALGPYTALGPRACVQAESGPRPDAALGPNACVQAESGPRPDAENCERGLLYCPCSTLPLG